MIVIPKIENITGSFYEINLGLCIKFRGKFYFFRSEGSQESCYVTDLCLILSSIGQSHHVQLNYSKTFQANTAFIFYFFIQRISRSWFILQLWFFGSSRPLGLVLKASLRPSCDITTPQVKSSTTLQSALQYLPISILLKICGYPYSHCAVFSNSFCLFYV